MSELSEVLAAFTILLPSAVCVSKFVYSKKSLPNGTELACIGCMIHAPFSFSLHMYKAMCPCGELRRTLYAMDIIGIHIWGILTGFSWWYMHKRYKEIQFLYHLTCIVFIIDNVYNVSTQPFMEKNIGIGAVLSTFPMIFSRPDLWFVSQMFWALAFWVHQRDIFGNMTSAIMHSLLVFPQYCILHRN